MLAVGGVFEFAGEVSARSIALWDGVTWAALGRSLTREPDLLPLVFSLHGIDGVLYAGGVFDGDDAGGDFGGIASWDGVAWSSLGAGVRNITTEPTIVRAIADQRGRVIAAGEFIEAGGVSAARVAAWSGSSWTPLLGGGTSGAVYVFTEFDNLLIAGGSFNQTGGVFTRNVAAFDGVEWRAMGDGLRGTVYAAAVFNGQLYVGGEFDLPDGGNIARWDGQAWQSVGGGISGVGISAELFAPRPTVQSLHVADGRLYVGGAFSTAGSEFAASLASWDGVQWRGEATFIDGIVFDIATIGGDLHVSGYFNTVEGVSALSIAARNGQGLWRQVGTGLSGNVYRMENFRGNLTAVGSFGQLNNGRLGQYIASFRNGDWVGVASGTALLLGPASNIGEYPAVDTLVYRNELYVSSYVEFAGSTSPISIAKYNGNVWSEAGAAFGGRSLGEYRGELIAGGSLDVVGNVVTSAVARRTPGGIPWVARQPSDIAASRGEVITFRATPAIGYANVRFTWLRNGVALLNGPQGAGRGNVSNASGQLPSPTDGTAAALTISEVDVGDSGEYRVVFTSPCGSEQSRSVVLSVQQGVPTCIADFNSDGGVDGGDVEAFFRAFATGSPTTDVNFDGGVDGADVETFYVAWQNGEC
jgi:hypothetical protein